MNQLVIYENKLSPEIKADIENLSPVIATVKTKKELEVITEVAMNLSRQLAPATEQERIQSIAELFILQSSSNGQQSDFKLEQGLYISKLEGHPAQSIQKAVDILTKRDKFRNFSALYQEVELQSSIITSKISRLKQIKEKSLLDMAEEEASQIAWNSKPTEKTMKLAEDGNQFAKIFTETKGELDNENM